MRTLFKLESGRATSGSDGADAILLESERYILTEAGSRISLDVASASYTASAVHFDGNAWLNIGSLSSADNGLFALAFWFKAVAPEDNSYPIVYAVDPINSYESWGGIDNNDRKLHFRLSDGTFATDTTSSTLGPSYLDNAWHCAVLALDTVTGPDTIRKLYIDRVDVTNSGTDHVLSPLFNGLAFFVCGDSFAGDGWIGDMADLRIAVGQNWLTGGDVSSATLDLFQDAITLKPINPAVATATLGVPAILFSGNATPGSFDLNQGTGGAFILTGSLTNASTSPSD